MKILATLETVKTLGVASPQGREALSELGRTVVGHLKQEDLQIYARLQARASQDPRLKKTLAFFGGEAREISDLAARFFSDEVRQTEDFEIAKAFGVLCARLTNRIRREETELFSEFERAFDSA